MDLILEIKGDEERGNWIVIHNEDRSDLHGIWDVKYRIMRGGGACVKNERQQNCLKNFVASHEGTRPPGRARRRNLIGSNTGVRGRSESVEGHAKFAVARQNNNNVLVLTKYDWCPSCSADLTFSFLSPFLWRRCQFLTLYSVADRRMNEYEH